MKLSHAMRYAKTSQGADEKQAAALGPPGDAAAASDTGSTAEG